MGNTPSIPTDPTKTTLVIGAGFSRTGTVSLSLALERLLGSPVCHSGTAILGREEAFLRSWTQLCSPRMSSAEKRKLLANLTRGYVAITDSPANTFVEELVELYPDAIVIVTTREREEWWVSAKELFKKTDMTWLDVLFWPVGTLRWFGEWREAMKRRSEEIYGCTVEEMTGSHLITLHEDYIRRVVPASRLHFISVKDGWGPLCKILNVPIPDEPFPRANDKQAMEEFFIGMLKGALLRWVQIFGVGGVIIGAGIWAGRR